MFVFIFVDEGIEEDEEVSKYFSPLWLSSSLIIIIYGKRSTYIRKHYRPLANTVQWCKSSTGG